MRAFIDVLIDNDEKVASYKKNKQTNKLPSRRVQKPSLLMTKMAKIDTLFNSNSEYSICLEMKGLKKDYLRFALDEVFEFGHTVESMTVIWTKSNSRHYSCLRSTIMVSFIFS